MNSKITTSKKTLAYLIFSLLSISLSIAQSVPDPNTSCSSSDFQVVAAKITGGDICNACTSGTMITRTLTLTIHSTTSSSRSFGFWGTLKIYNGTNGSLSSSTVRTGCVEASNGSGTYDMDFGTITYPCGSTISIDDLWMAWGSNDNVCASLMAHPESISPKCGKLSTVKVNAGVNGEFVQTDSQCGLATGALDLSPTGGTAPYTYLWSGPNGFTSTNQDVTGLLPGTYSVTIKDANNCSITKTRTISGLDTQKPNITCPSDKTIEGCDLSALSSTGLTYSTVTKTITSTQMTSAGVSFSDSCPLASFSYLDSASGTNPTIVTRTFTVTDSAGNSNSCTQTLTLSDTQKPTVVSCAPTVDLVADSGSCSATNVTLVPPTFADSCGTSQLNVSNNHPSTTFPIGNTTVIWTATDAAGNSVTCTQTVTVRDNQKPTVVTCAPTVDLNADSGSCSASNVTLVAPTFADNCNASQLTVSNDHPSKVFPIGNTTVIWTATDAAGNSVTCTQTVTVHDNQKPTVVTCAPTVDLVADSGSCSATNVTLVAPTFADNCSASQLNISNDHSSTTFPIGNTTVIWTATDAAGNSVTCTQTVTVRDNQKPTVVTCAPTVDLLADSGSCSASNVALVAPTFADNCSASQLTVTNNHPSTTFPIGNTTVIWTATDAAGNSVTCTQTVTVRDNQKPTVVTCASTVDLVADSGSCSAGNVTLVAPTFADNCNASQLTVSNDHPSKIFPIGNTTVIWTATDAAGNSVTCTQTVTVRDNQKPIAPILTDVSGQCSATVVTPTTSDNCAGIITATTTDPLVYNDQGTYTVHWAFNDGNGNITTVNQKVVVDNTVPPSPPILADVIGQCSATVPIATVVNSCTHVSINGTTSDPLSYTKQGTYTIHWTFDDGNNNIVTASQKVIVADTQKPVVANCAPAVNVTADSGLCTASNVTLGAPTVSDNCTANPVTMTNDAPAVFPIGTTTVTWTIKDVAGNISTCTQTVTVTDNQKPTVATCAAPVSVTADKDSCSASNVNLGTPTASDNCTLNPLTMTNDAPATFPIGTTTVTWTIKDIAGNISTCTQTVTVTDNQIPTVVSCAPLVSVSADKDACSASNVNIGKPSASDNCTANPLTITNDAPTVFPIGTTTVTWTIKDVAGNIATCTQTVTVTDNQIPTVTACAAPVSVTADKDSCSASNVNIGKPTASDNCTVNPLTMTNDAPAVFPIGTTTVTWTIKDVAGNIAICTQTVTVTDNQIPTVTACAVPVNVVADKDACSATNVKLGAPTASDNCTLNPVTMTNDAPAVFPIGTTTVIWTIKDAANNTVTCSQTVTVTDDQKPIVPLSALADVKGQCSATVTPPTAPDNCAGMITATTEDPLIYKEQGSFIVHWTFNDGNGNIATANQNVIVDNTIPPAAPVLADIIGECSATASIPTVVNNCYQNAINGTTADPLTYDQQGTYVIHWSFGDGNGNITTVNQNVIVHDTTVPVLIANIAPADVTVECSAIPAASTADFTATDNCDANPIVTFSEDKQDGNCPGSYTLIRTWTATDASGNFSSISQKVTVQDTTPPVFTSVIPKEIAASCDNIPIAETMTATDSCGTATVSFLETKTDGSCLGNYTLTRTWTATDACGNIASFVQNINVSDTVPPTIEGTFQNMVTVRCDQIPPIPKLQLSDNCSGIGEITEPLADDNIINKTEDSYTIIRTWKVSDLCGNESTFIQTINVIIKDALTTLSLDACNADETTYNLNMLIPMDYVGKGTWTDLSASGGLKGDNDGIFSPYGIPTGNYTLEYDVNDPVCPRKIQINALVNNDCKVLPCGTITVHNFFSPNGDGYNDVFTIENINDFTCFPTNKVRIYNRWGALLFETEGYDNNEKAFRGISQAGATINQAAELPSGTYFYVLEYTSDTKKDYKESGYLYLSR